MEEIFKVSALLLNQRLSAKIRGLLHFIFVGIIASFIYVRNFGQYQLVNFTDYSKVYFFLIGGGFIIPFAIFFLTWQFTSLIGVILFRVPNLLLANWLKPKISKFIKGETVLTPSEREPKPIVEPKRIEFLHIKIEREFNLLVRGFIAVTFYYCSSKAMPCQLYALIIVTILALSFLQIIAYQMAILLPFGAAVIMADSKAD